MRIMQRIWWGSIIIALLTAGIAYRVYAQTPDFQYFPETNHTVSGEFYDFYRAIPEPYAVLGFPITDAAEDPVTHLTVQYFQLGRLELHPDATEGKRVTMSDLGTLLYTPGAPLADIPTSGPACRYFPATGKSVCYAFLQYYDAHDGAKYFGNPISQLEIRDGRFVQYFEKVRMEWRGEAPEGHRAGLTDLGRIYHDMIEGRSAEAEANNSNIVQRPSGTVSLNVHAFVEKSLLPAGSQQKLYIIVQDQDLQPVANATTGVVVTLPNGHQEFYRPPVSDANGISVFDFNVGSVDVKQIVKVEVVATVPGLEQHTTAWFRIWW